MEKVLNFMIDNYLWLIAVLVILIVTVIGFLADVRTKNKRSMKEEVKSEESKPVEKPVEPQVNLANSQVQVDNQVNTPNPNVTQAFTVPSEAIPVQPVQNYPGISNQAANNQTQMGYNNINNQPVYNQSMDNQGINNMNQYNQVPVNNNQGQNTYNQGNNVPNDNAAENDFWKL